MLGLPFTSSVYEGCLIPQVNKAIGVISPQTNGAKLGESITVSCPDIRNRKFSCQAGNTWEPADVAGACFGEKYIALPKRG